MIGEVMMVSPEAAEKLVTKYGLHCVGCGMAAMESLEEGLAAHGMSPKEIERVVADLNGSAQ